MKKNSLHINNLKNREFERQGASEEENSEVRPTQSKFESSGCLSRAEPSDYLYEIKELSFSYLLGKQNVQAIRSLELRIPKGSLISISGPSGSGKSTLLNILGLIEPIQTGQVLFLGQ